MLLSRWDNLLFKSFGRFWFLSCFIVIFMFLCPTIFHNLVMKKYSSFICSWFWQVKTTSPKKYCVRPNVGIIKPKATFDFTGIYCISSLISACHLALLKYVCHIFFTFPSRFTIFHWASICISVASTVCNLDIWDLLWITRLHEELITFGIYHPW